MLAGEGLVEARTSGGFHLPSIDEPGLEDLYAWAGEVAALAIRAWPRGKPPPVGRADPALRRSPADWAAAMFDTVGRRSANAEHGRATRSEEHTSELQSLMRISYAVFCLKQKKP